MDLFHGRGTESGKGADAERKKKAFAYYEKACAADQRFYVVSLSAATFVAPQAISPAITSSAESGVDRIALNVF